MQKLLTSLSVHLSRIANFSRIFYWTARNRTYRYTMS